MAMRVLKSIMFLEDGWHFSEVIDVRTFQGQNIDSDRYLVVCKICVIACNGQALEPPTLYEVKKTVRELAAGKDEISVMFLKVGSERLNEKSTKLLK